MIRWLRSAAFNLWFWGVAAVFILGLVPFLPRGPGPWAAAYARRWVVVILAGLRGLCGVRWDVRGLENLPTDGPALIASNHQSAFDTSIWFLIAPRPSYVLKAELMRIPLFGGLCRKAGLIAVRRNGGAAAMRALVRDAATAAQEGRQIVIFPEGTRVAPGQSAPLHPGIAAIALHSGLPVIPVVTDSGRYWGRRAFRKTPGVIRIEIHPPIPAGTPRALLMRQLEAVFAAGVRTETNSPNPMDMKL